MEGWTHTLKVVDPNRQIPSLGKRIADQQAIGEESEDIGVVQDDMTIRFVPRRL